MSYANFAHLSFDSTFRDRVIACCKEQALIFKDDGRADIAALARDVIANPRAADGVVELVCVAPNFADVTDSATIEDADILASVQAQWPTYAAVTHPPTT